MSLHQPAYVASEDIQPSVFVNIVDSTDYTIETCDAGDVSIGVMHESTWEAALPGVSNPPAVVTGYSKRVYGLGEVCDVVAGGAIDASDRLKPDTNGHAVVAGAGEEYSAVALADAASGELCRVLIERGSIPA